MVRTKQRPDIFFALGRVLAPSEHSWGRRLWEQPAEARVLWLWLSSEMWSGMRPHCDCSSSLSRTTCRGTSTRCGSWPSSWRSPSTSCYCFTRCLSMRWSRALGEGQMFAQLGGGRPNTPQGPAPSGKGWGSRLRLLKGV